MKAIPAILAALFVATVPLTGCKIYSSPNVWQDRSGPVAVSDDGWNDLQVETRNGHITVTGSDSGEMSIVAKVRGGGDDDQDAALALEAVEIYTVLEGNTQKVSWGWKNDDPQPQWGASVAFEIVLPSSRSVRAITRNGSLTVMDINSVVCLVQANH